MKKLKILLSVMIMSLVMVGCGGGGGDSLPVIDNATLTDTENQYGFFGEDVVFVNQKIVGSWFLAQDDSDAGATLNFNSDGDGTYQQKGSTRILYGDYGVSQDGKTLTQ